MKHGWKSRLLFAPLVMIIFACAEPNAPTYADLDDLRASLEANQHTPATLVTAGKALSDRFHQAGEPENALAVLDELARATTAEELQRYTLESWYVAIDSVNGPERFWEVRVDTEASIPVLEPTDLRANLAGQYIDVTTGDAFDLASLEGKTVVLDFWTTWCAPCLAEIPTLNAFQDQLGSDEVLLVSICSDASEYSTEELRTFVEEHGIEFIALADKSEASLTEQFDVNTFPTKKLVNPQGVLMRRPFARRSSWVSLDQVKQYLEAEPLRASDG